MPKTYNSPEHYHNIELLIQQAANQVVVPGDTAIDIGSNFLLHSAHLLTLVGNTGKVLAFEPLFHPVQYSREYMQQHNINNLILHQVALSNFSGTADFYENTSLCGFSGLQMTQFEHNSLNTSYKQSQVTVDQLDNFSDQIQNLSFIKIDVEGSELNVMLGGDSVITQYRPVIACEVCDYFLNLYGQSESELINWMTQHGYTKVNVANRLQLDLYIFVHDSRPDQLKAIGSVMPLD
jgi:FkbM family methyltransferase